MLRLLVLVLLSLMPSVVFAGQVEINGDNVEYSLDGQKVIITGNVEIKYMDAVLMSDYAEFIKADNAAYARGNVKVKTPDGDIVTDEITYDFDKQKIETASTRVTVPPFYASGDNVSRREDGTIVVCNGKFTTSDYDDPEYYVQASHFQINPETNKLKADDVRMKLGPIPLFYLPKFSQKINNPYPSWHHKAGYDGDWGAFLLSDFGYDLGERVSGTVHLDYRELKDFAWGVDTHYDTPAFGSGMLRTYYMNERERFDNHWGESENPPTDETERYLAELRHMYKSEDQRTQVIAQASHLKDDVILKEYFERRYDRDPLPSTFVAATHYLDYGALSLRAMPRVNEFYSQSEYLPELRFDLPETRIADLGLYWKNTTAASYLTSRTSGIAQEQDNNGRVDLDHDFSYPVRLGAVHLTPHIGSRHTYYRKTFDPTEDRVSRNMLQTGITASTKFFKMFDVDDDGWLGRQFEQVRHVMTPAVSYEYVSDPTMDAVKIRSFDDVDLLDTEDYVRLSLDNKIQGKRSDGQTVDVLRVQIGTTYNFEEDKALDVGFQTVDLEMEVKPVHWMTFYFDTIYDTDRGSISVLNTDLAFNKGKWTAGFGHRYDDLEDDLLTTHVGFRPNLKWNFQVYERFDMDESELEEQEYVISRDLHAWTMDITFNDTQNDGEEFWVIFKLKDFPAVDTLERYGQKYHVKETGVSSEIPEGM